jgi:phage tail protein X
MKPRIKLPTITAGALVAVWLLSGCATFETTAYRTLGTTAATVDTVMTAYADAYAAGQSTPAIDRKVDELWLEYRKATLASKIAVETYRAGKGSEDAVYAALAGLAANKEQLRALILTIVLPSKAAAIQRLP